MFHNIEVSFETQLKYIL